MLAVVRQLMAHPILSINGHWRLIFPGPLAIIGQLLSSNYLSTAHPSQSTWRLQGSARNRRDCLGEPRLVEIMWKSCGNPKGRTHQKHRQVEF
jgi:hypothetical protein